MSENLGTVVQVIGPVIDVSFEGGKDQIPPIYTALQVLRDNGEELILEVEQHIGEDTGRVRFTAAVFAIGFFLGMIAKCVVGGSYIALALYALGFVLSYTAVVFTVPEKEHAYEGR